MSPSAEKRIELLNSVREIAKKQLNPSNTRLVIAEGAKNVFYIVLPSDTRLGDELTKIESLLL